MLKWALRASFTGLYLIYAFLAGRWDRPSYYLRYIWLMLYVLVVVISFGRMRGIPFFTSDGRKRWWGLAGHVFALLITILLAGFALRGRFISQQSVRLELSLDEARY